MPVAFGSINNTTYAGGRTSTAIPAPSGITVGDLLIIGHVYGGNPATTITPPSGFSTVPGLATLTVGPISGFTANFRCYYKFADSADAAASTFTLSHTSGSSQGVMLRYTGVDTTDPFEPAPTGNSGTAADTTATGFTTAVNDTMVVLLAFDWGDTANNLTPPVGTTPTFIERLDSVIMYAADGVMATAGATGNKTFANNANTTTGGWGAVLLGLRPAVGGGANVTLTPVAQTATGGTLAPSVATGTNVTVGPAAAAATGASLPPIPAVILTPTAATAVGGMPTLTPVATFTADAATATGGTLAPSVSTGSNVTVTPPAVGAQGGTLAPGVALSLSRVLSAVAAQGGTLTPTVQTSGNVAVSPPAQAAQGGTLAPLVSLGATVTPAAASAVGLTRAPSVDTAGNALITPQPAAATGGTLAPTVARGSVLTLAASVARGGTVPPAQAGPVVVYIGRAEATMTYTGRVG